MPDTNSSMPYDDRLRPDEVLVRDGTAKLVLCWAAVCLAHRAQIENHHGPREFSARSLERAKQLFRLLEVTSYRKGMGSQPSKATEGAGMLAPMSWPFMESLHQKRWNATLMEMAEILARRDCPVSPSLIAHGLKGKSWFQFNDFVYDKGMLDALRRCVESGAETTGKGLHRAQPLVRFLWGSSQSIERVSVVAYEAGTASLTAFDTTTKADPKRASPIPFGLVERWARILGFWPKSHSGSDGELPAGSPSDEEITRAWEAFCGRGERVKTGVTLHGGTVQDFAGSFQALLDEPTYLERVESLARISAERVNLSPGKSSKNVAGRKEWAASDAPDYKSCSEKPASARTRLVARHDPNADRDDIAMTIDSAPDWPRLTIEDLVYCIDPELRDGADEHDTRLCTRKLVLEWQWDRADAVLLHGSRVDRIRAVERDNPGLTLNSNFDSLYVRITISAPPGEVLPPSFEVAVDRLVLPEADIAPGTNHRFCLSLPDSAVVFGRLDLSTGRYCSLETDERALQKPSRIAATLIEKLDARIRNRLEPDRTGSVPLGRRIAIAARPAEEGVP